MDVRRAGIALALGLGLLAVGGAPAAADTLYTDATHTDGVTVNSTADLASGTLTLSGTFGSTRATDVCTSSTLTTQIRQNDGAVLAATVTGGTFAGCSTGVPVGNFPWTVTVRADWTGIGGGTRVYGNTTWNNVSISAFTTFTGTFSDASPSLTGAFARQPTASGAPVCFVLANAGPLSGPGVTDVRLDATYCPTGGAATSWSFGSSASYLRAGPGNALVASGATISGGSTTTSVLGVGTGSALCSSATLEITAGASGGTVVTGGLDNLTMTSCTDTIPNITVTSCARFNAGTSPVSFTAASAFVTATGVYLRCALAATTNGCYYNAPASGGTLSNSLTLVGVITHQVPAGVTDDTGLVCGTSGGIGLNSHGLTTGSATAVTLRTF